MAEASVSSDTEEKEDSKTVEDESPSFRRLCEHYSRGCSFIVSTSFLIASSLDNRRLSSKNMIIIMLFTVPMLWKGISL